MKTDKENNKKLTRNEDRKRQQQKTYTERRQIRKKEKTKKLTLNKDR